MAFMGMFIAAIAIIIFLGIIFFVLLFLIIGLVKKKKQKKSATVFFVLSGMNAVLVILILFLVFGPKKEEIETPTGTVEVWRSVTKKYEDAMENRDLEKLDSMLSKHPELVYYTDNNVNGILQYGMSTCNIEMMELGIRYGAKFDDALVYDHVIYDGSFPEFFNNLGYRSTETYVAGETTDEILETVKFMSENGADMERGASSSPANFLFTAIYWIKGDKKISEKDMELILYVVNQGCTLNESYANNETVFDAFEESIGSMQVDEDAKELVDQFEALNK